MANDDVLRRLRGAGLRPGGPVPGAIGLDINERQLLDRITNSNDAQVAIAKQQLQMNEKQFAANMAGQEIAHAQWLLVYAADIFKFCVQSGVTNDDVYHQARNHILRVFADEPDAGTTRVGVAPQPLRVEEARKELEARGHEQPYEGRHVAADTAEREPVGGFVEHEPAE